jgi:hypothetical protein
MWDFANDVARALTIAASGFSFVILLAIAITLLQ